MYADWAFSLADSEYTWMLKKMHYGFSNSEMLKRKEKERWKLYSTVPLHYSKGFKKVSIFQIYVCSNLCWKLARYYLWSEYINVPEIVLQIWLLVITLGLSHFLLKCVTSTIKMNHTRKNPSLKVAPSWNFNIVHLF